MHLAESKNIKDKLKEMATGLNQTVTQHIELSQNKLKI